MGAGSGYTGSEKRLYQQAGEFFQSFFSGNIGFPLPQVVTAEITELGGRRFFLAVGECFCICIQSGKFFFQRIREVFWEKTEIFTVCGSLDLYGKLQLPEFYQIFEHGQVCLSRTAFKIAQREAEELALLVKKKYPLAWEDERVRRRAFAAIMRWGYPAQMAYQVLRMQEFAD